MVATLDRIQLTAVVMTIIAAFTLFMWIRGERYPKILIYSGIMTLLGWGGYIYKRSEILKAAESFMKPIELKSYYSKENCVLQLEDDFRYSISQDSILIKEGDWNFYAKGTRMLLLDGEVFGLDELEMK